MILMYVIYAVCVNLKATFLLTNKIRCNSASLSKAEVVVIDISTLALIVR